MSNTLANMQSATQASQSGGSTGQRQLNIRALYPQVKQSTTPISFEAGMVGPVITFDNHYSSDEEMAGPNAGKRGVLLGQQYLGKKSTTTLPIRKREEQVASPKVSEAVLGALGSQREAALLRNDEGLTAIKRRKVDAEAVNTQTSVRTADTMSDLKVSPSSFEMSQSMSEVTQPSQKAATQEEKQPAKGVLSANTLKQIQLLKQIQGKQVPQKKPAIDQIKPLSSATSQVLKDILGQRKQAASPSKQLQPVSLEELLSQDNQMRAKHEQLIVPERELVLPIHHKKLLELLKFIDNTLNFLKSCRRQSSCTFDDIKKSIERTNARSFDLDSFKQILFLMPLSFTHRWDSLGGRATLMIDFPDEEKQISQQKMEERQASLKKLMIEETLKHHTIFVQQMQEKGERDPILRSDPMKTKMWHYKFDVHSVPAIKLAELKPQVKGVRSESVKDFLNRSKLNALVEPLNIAPKRQVEHSLEPTMQRKPSPVKDDSKLIEMSKKTGISIDTLRIIQSKQEAVTKAKEVINQSLQKEDHSKSCQELIKIGDQIRQAMLTKQKQTLPLKDVMTSLVDTQRGAFRSQADILLLVNQLCTLVPQWISVKDIGTAGKFVKCNSAISIQQVQEAIRAKITN